MSPDTRTGLRATRRALLLGAAGAAAVALLPGTAFAGVPVPRAKPAATVRRLGLTDVRTRETLDLVFWRDGAYVPETRSAFNRLLRDRHTGDAHAIDPRLFDLLHDLSVELGADAPYAVTCGYRSPATNAWMRGRRRGVAKHSLHMEGMAIDLWLPGRKLGTLRTAARDMARGGVGYYPRKGFVHLDVGDVRSWTG